MIASGQIQTGNEIYTSINHMTDEEEIEIAMIN